jgi:two-component sensor histidine kinase
MSVDRRPDFRLLFESVPGLYLVLTPALEIVAASDRYLEATMTTREIIGRAMFDVFPDNPADSTATGVRNLSASLNRVIAHKRTDAMAVQKYDVRRNRNQGEFEERWWSPVNSPVVDEDGQLRYIIHRVEDVTDFVRLRQRSGQERERMEAEIHLRAQQLQAANDQLRASLAERETLLKEVHHRVKNNLEVIDSLLQLQADATPELGLRAALADTSARVHAIAEVHRHLYAMGDLASIDMKQYARTLSSSISHVFEGARDRVRISVAGDAVKLELRRAVPAALLLNELLSNALKHAFPGDRQGEIEVRFTNGDAWVEMSVSDDGVGLPDPLPSGSLGFDLVRVLAQQLDGTATFARSGGTSVRVRFPMERAV